jgi:hypothetical protein
MGGPGAKEYPKQYFVASALAATGCYRTLQTCFVVYMFFLLESVPHCKQSVFLIPSTGPQQHYGDLQQLDNPGSV